MAERVGIDELLEQVRSGLDRIEPRAAHEAYEAGDALLVDTRYAALRERDGLIPGALIVERNELEWRLDPLGSHRAAEADSHDLRVVVLCNEGYASPSRPSPCAAWACTGRLTSSAASRPGRPPASRSSSRRPGLTRSAGSPTRRTGRALPPPRQKPPPCRKPLP